MTMTFQSHAIDEHLATHFSSDERKLLNTARLLYVDLLRDICLFEEAVLEKSTLIDAHVFQLPSFTDDDIGEIPTAIDVTPLTGQRALECTMLHLHALEQEHDHSARIIKRLPGIIALSHPEPDSLRARIFTINQKKAQFHLKLIELCPDPNKRFELLVMAMPNVVKLKVFRDILFANRPLYSVGFSWKHRQSKKKLGKHELLAMLDKSLAYYQKRFPLSEKTRDIEIERDTISAYPATSRFVQARSLRVAPAMNLNYVKHTAKHIDTASAPVDMIAHSPLFVFNQSLKIHPLKPYNIENAGQTAKVEHELVLPRLCIYFDPTGSKPQSVVN